MGWKDFFKKKKENGPDPLADLILSKLRVGYMVDFDMQTWRVTAYNQYDWGSGELTYEWQLESLDETIYLEREADDEDDWSIGRKIAIGRLGSGIKAHIRKDEAPPDEITFEGITYYLEESGSGHFLKDGKGPGQKFFVWDYEDDSGKKFLSIEQWGKNDFEASTGISVEEYQFTNILPGKK